MAATDFFLKIDGIEGESTQQGHEKEIEIQSWSFGVTNKGTFAGNMGGGAGKASFQDIHITVPINKASPKFWLACATGQHIKSALLTARKAGGKQVEYLKIKLTDLLISSYVSNGTDDVEGTGILPMDSISLNFTKFEIAYAPQKIDGSLEAAINAGYDLKKGTKV